MTQINPGDVVRLKSGGPPMTVADKDHLGRYVCTWFANNEVKTEALHGECLCKLKRRRVLDDEWDESDPA